MGSGGHLEHELAEEIVGIQSQTMLEKAEAQFSSQEEWIQTSSDCKIRTLSKENMSYSRYEGQ